MYLRELPDCLLTMDLYAEWIAAARIADHNEKLYAVQVRAPRLPPAALVCTARTRHSTRRHATATINRQTDG